MTVLTTGLQPDDDPLTTKRWVKRAPQQPMMIRTVDNLVMKQ